MLAGIKGGVGARRSNRKSCSIHVERGRSSFQAVSFRDHPTEKPFETVDLGTLERFGIFPHNIADHEELLRRIYGLLSAI